MGTVARPDPPGAARERAPGAHRQPAGRWVLPVALALVAVQTGLRIWVLSGRTYYGDDFDLLHLADRSALLSPSYLLTDYVGHLMPGAFLVAGLVERAGPLEWGPALVSLVALQLLASLALLRLLRVLLGDRPALLVPLALGLFSPMTLGFATWWAAALNSVPLQIGLAWFLADAVLLARTGRRRHAVSGTAALVFALAFYLKAVLVLPIGVGLLAVVLLRDGVPHPVRAALRRGRALWAGSGVVLAVWAVTYLATRETRVISDGSARDVLLTVTTGFEALAQAALGGPFSWDIRPPSTPIAGLPASVVVAGAVLLLAACAGTVLLLRGAAAVWALVVVTVAAGLLMAALGRSGAGLGEVAPRAYRYYAVESVLLPVAVALLASLPPRRTRDPAVVRPAAGFPRWAVPFVAVLTALFVGGSLLSTAGYARAWREDRTAGYLATARASLAAAGPTPLLEQPLPSDVLSDWSYPGNLTSHALAPLPDRPPFSSSTPELRLLDDAGHLVPARLEPGIRVLWGPVPSCGYLVSSGQPATLPLESAVPDWVWTVRLDYLTAADAVLTVAPEGGAPVDVPVTAGAGSVFVRMTGPTTALQVARTGDGPDVCVLGGVLGQPVL
ncbi:hypothetical protein [Blastococcus sp. SYSU D01042]